MAVTSSARSSAELFAETPRHLHDVRETSEGGREGDREGDAFDDDARDAGVPPKSPASPTRRGDRAAAAAATLTRDTPLEEGVYVSEPHFAPPRMDESQAWVHGDPRGGADWDPASLFSQSLAVAPSPSSTRRSPPLSGGFVPSPAERRAAALALEREGERAPDDSPPAETAEEARETAEPESGGEVRWEETNLIRAVPEPTVPPRGVREEDLELEQFSKEDSERARDASISERGPDAVDPAFLAALMAEAEADAEEDASLRTRLEDENENQNENENASELKKEHDDAEDGAEVGEPPRAEVSAEFSASAARVVLENENENENETSSRDDDDENVSTRTRDAYVPSPRVSLDADEGAFSDSSAPMTASPKPATRKPFSFEDIPPSARDAESGIRFEDTLETPFDFGNPSGFPKSGNGKRRETGTSGSRAETVTRDRSAIERLSPSGASAASVSPPPREDTRGYLVATPRAVSARSAFETRRRAAERERAEAARLFKARREEAGREALRRFFADAKPKPTRNGAPSRSSPAAGEAAGDEPAARPGAPRTPLRLKRDPRRALAAKAETPSPKRTPSPKVASPRAGDRRHAEISATAAAAQAAKAAVFEAARAAAAAAKPAGSDGDDAEENAVGFFFHDASRARGTRRKPTDVAALTANVAAVPRVATLDDASRLAEARDELAAVAAADRAADSVEKLTRAAAAAASRREALAPVADTPEPSARGAEGADANGDGFDKSMPARRQPRPPLPAVASFEPEQRTHVPRAEAAAAAAARERAQAEALAAIKARAAAARAEAAAARAALDAEKAEAAAASRDRHAARASRSSIEEAFPSWFGADPGFATGAAGLGEIAPRADGASAERTRLRRETPPASPSPPPPARPASATRDWPASPERAATPSEAASADTEGGPLMPSAPPRKKGEAMWVDVGAWGDAAAAGVPSGGWGDAQLSEEARRRPRLRGSTPSGTARLAVGGSGTGGRDDEAIRDASNASNASNASVPSGAFLAQQLSLASVAAARAERARSARVPRGAAPPPRASPVPSTVAAYKSASRLSNRKLIRNALSHVCLAGAAMRAAREKALQALDDVPPERAATFVIAFRENVAPHRFRALYALVDESGDAAPGKDRRRLVKIHGAAGPASVALSGVESTMKYDSGTREFKPLATSAVGPQTAAVVLSKR